MKNCIKDIKDQFNISEMGVLNEIVGVKYIQSDKSHLISEADMIEDFAMLFDIDDEKHNTPAAPGQVLLKGTRIQHS